MLLGHGDDWYNSSTPVKANFSSNVWYGASHEALQLHLQQHFDSINSYPHPCARELQVELAQQHGVEEKQILVTNGAIEAIYLLAQLFQSSKSAIVTPTFSEYEDACRIFGHWCTFFDKQHLTQTAREEFSTVWLCNPNNPDGSLINAALLRDLIAQHAQTHWVIDEVYQDFLATQDSVLLDRKIPENLFIIKSLTKRFKIPGLRLGYIIASKKNIAALQAIKQPWSVNSLAIAAGAFLCKNQQLYSFDIQNWLSTTANLQSKLEQLGWITPQKSNTPFFISEIQGNTSGHLKQFLQQEWGILIRDASTFKALSNKYIRLCTQSDEHNQLLLTALKDYTSKHLT